MAFTNSLSALDLKLEIYEVEALIDWHRENEDRESNRGAYNSADASQQRANNLFDSLTRHREALEAARDKRRPSNAKTGA